MSRAALLLIFCAFLAARKSDSQQTNTAHSTGSCSPAISGNSNQMVISCNGLSSAKATQLVTLMNKILSENLDLSAVNKKLDQLQIEFGGLHGDMGGLKQAIAPLSFAPDVVRKRLSEGNLLSLHCNNLTREWLNRKIPLQGRDHSQELAELTAKELDEYRRTLQDSLIAWREGIRRVSPELVSKLDYRDVHTDLQLSGVCGDFTIMGSTYMSIVSDDIKNAPTK